MIDLKQLQKELGQNDLTDKQLEQFRDALYAIVENIVDDYYQSFKESCKKH